MHFKLAIVTALTAVAAFALLLTSRGSEAGEVPIVSIDMDISDGACTDIDASREQAAGTFQVAICLVDNPTGVAVAAFQFRVNYDDTVIIAPEVANAGSALDDNPDANIGVTSFSTPNLGTDPASWTCATVGAFPVGDTDGVAGNGTGQAFSGGCGNESGTGVTLVTGPLSVITFNVVGTGQTTLTLANTSATNNDLSEIGSCNPTQEIAAQCNGGTFSTGAVATATNTPTATNTTAPATNTPTATNTTAPETNTPTATNTTAPATNTPTATNTTAPETNTPTATNTTAPETNTPTATNTTAPATNTPTATNTTAPATNTPTATNTTAPATNTPTATNTTAPATNTPTATNTTAPATNTPTATSVPGDCEEDVNNDGKVNARDIVIVAKSMHDDDPEGDVDGDGDVDVRDLLLVVKAMIRIKLGGTC